MNNLVSIITPVAPNIAQHLPDAYRSIARQSLPPGWDLEWLVQQDGHEGDVSPLIPTDDSRVRLSRSRRGGAATARNMALARARGDLVKVLDSDDQLADGALSRDIAALESSSSTDWVTSRVLDLLPDGSTEGFDNDPPAGYIRPGDVLRHWQRHGHRASVHPATLCARTSLVVMLGGWMALPASEDTGLLLALNAISSGHFLAEPGLLYRKWPGQATASAAHDDPDEWSARMRLIERRAVQLLEAPNPMRDAVLDANDPG